LFWREFFIGFRKKKQAGLIRGKIIYLFAGAREGEPVLQLAIFADIHSDWEGLQKAVLKVNNNKSVDFVLVLGDLTDLGSIDNLNISKNILDGLNVNYYVVPGNHDLWYSRRDGNLHDYNFVQVFGDQPACFLRKVLILPS